MLRINFSNIQSIIEAVNGIPSLPSCSNSCANTEAVVHVVETVRQLQFRLLALVFFQDSDRVFVDGKSPL